MIKKVRSFLQFSEEHAHNEQKKYVDTCKDDVSISVLFFGHFPPVGI